MNNWLSIFIVDVVSLVHEGKLEAGRISLILQAMFGFWHYVQIIHVEALAFIVHSSLLVTILFLGSFFRAHGPFFLGILTSGPKTPSVRFSNWTYPRLRFLQEAPGP